MHSVCSAEEIDRMHSLLYNLWSSSSDIFSSPPIIRCCWLPSGHYSVVSSSSPDRQTMLLERKTTQRETEQKQEKRLIRLQSTYWLISIMHWNFSRFRFISIKSCFLPQGYPINLVARLLLCVAHSQYHGFGHSSRAHKIRVAFPICWIKCQKTYARY